MEPAALERRDSPDSDTTERKEEEGSRAAAAAAASGVPAAAATSSSRIRITQDCVAGGPITCVSLVAASSSSSVVCVYGHGPFLHRTSIITTTSLISSDNHENDGSQRPLLVFPEGGSIHGIRYDQQTNDASPALTVLYGGRQVAFVRNVTNRNAPMEVLAIVDARNHENDPEESTKRHHLTLGDWIWDVRCYGSSSSRKLVEGGKNDMQQQRMLLVGLAHNTVQVWSVVEETAAATPAPEPSSAINAHHGKRTRIRARPVRTIQGTTRSISYCIDLWLAPPASAAAAAPQTTTITTTIAVGTVTNEILVWSLSGADFVSENDNNNSTTASVETTTRRRNPEHRLRGHKGVIHAVRFHGSGRWLASTSDDRSVRLWETTGEGWVLKWTAWGHTARGWDVAFASSSALSTLVNADVHRGGPGLILSTGEDGTMRVWDGRTGDALAVARGHACQCVWSVDAATGTWGDDDSRQDFVVAATGGNDGTVAFYNLQDRLERNHTPGITTTVRNVSEEADLLQDRPKLPRSWTTTFLLPDDRPVQTHGRICDDDCEEPSVSSIDGAESPETLSKQKTAKRRKVKQQVVVGMQFTPKETPPSLVVATRAGSLMRLTINGDWMQLEPWCGGAGDALEGSDGCCMSLHLIKPLVAVGTQKGDIKITSLRQQSSDKCVSDEGADAILSDHCEIVLSAREHRSVQRLEWLKSNVLLSFHVQSLVWWDFRSAQSHLPAASDKQETQDGIPRRLTLRKDAKGMVISHALDDSMSHLVVGDTRGNLELFALREQSTNGETVLRSTSVALRAHQKEHVTAIAWISRNRILSVGNDGHIIECRMEEGKLVMLLSVPVGSFTGLSNIWCYGEKQVVVGGYYGNRFAIVDVRRGYEFFSFDTGGRQRTLDIWTEDDNNASAFPAGSCVAMCVSRNDGRNDIQMHCCGIGDHRVSSAIPLGNLTRPSLQTCASISLHGETIFDVCIFPFDTKRNCLALLTGSEDCSAKLSLYRDGIISTSKLLPPHVSGIRAVCSCQLCGGMTILAIGSKVEIQLFLVYPFNDGDLEIAVRNLGFGHPPVKQSIDQRLNAIGAVPLSSDSGDDALVVTGDSSGSCYLYRYSGLQDSNSSYEVQLFYADDRPIIAVDIVKHDERYILLLGTTEGDIVAFHLPGAADPELWQELSIIPLLRYSAHSVGTNAISARLHVVSGLRRLRICSGGDDQAICCCDVALPSCELGNLKEATVLHTCRAENAAISALKGVKFIDDEHIVATGYDQRISVWEVGEANAELSLVADAAVDIGDINCLAHCEIGNNRHALAIGGAGVELLSVTTA